MQTIESENLISTAEVAQKAGIHKDTLLRWLRKGLIPEPGRDRNGWRVFSQREAKYVISFAKNSTKEDFNLPSITDRSAEILKGMDWDFIGAKTNYLTHGIHPYPAKFIPQIPNALIQELSSVGDTVGDIFCGSGTTLVEALTLKRNAVGIDANPLACLISRSKTTIIREQDVFELQEVAQKSRLLADSIMTYDSNTLFSYQKFKSKGWRPLEEGYDFWFEPHVIEELAECLLYCSEVKSNDAKEVALTAFSSIVVSVSKQDSDTRYVRREKSIKPGDTLRRFARAIEQCAHATFEFSELVESRFSCDVKETNILSCPSMPLMDLMVCSPPYPNAYSYHLYHRTRMLWLNMNQPRFKQEEIGSHRKYSSTGKNAATIETFRAEFELIMQWLAINLKKQGYACFVVGNSTLRGQRVDNASLICEAAKRAGFVEVARIERKLQDTKKAFNPAHGSIKTEKILVLKNVST